MSSRANQLCDTPVAYKQTSSQASGALFDTGWIPARGQARLDGSCVAGHQQDAGYPRIEESHDAINVANVIVVPQNVSPFGPAGSFMYPVNVRIQAAYIRIRTIYTDAGTPTAPLRLRIEARPDGDSGP